jgi:septum formation protein
LNDHGFHPRVADTVVLSKEEPIVSGYQATSLGASILEKPGTKEENLRMLQELNGKVCEVVTGVSLGEHASLPDIVDT